jgi:hypothetical protein
MDAVTLSKDIWSHLRVPTAGLMTEMHTCFQQMLHSKLRHKVLRLFCSSTTQYLFGTIVCGVVCEVARFLQSQPAIGNLKLHLASEYIQQKQ